MTARTVTDARSPRLRLRAQYSWEEAVLADVRHRRRRETPYTGIVFFSKTMPLLRFWASRSDARPMSSLPSFDEPFSVGSESQKPQLHRCFASALRR